MLTNHKIKTITTVILNEINFSYILRQLDLVGLLSNPRIELLIPDKTYKVELPFAACPPCLKLASEKNFPIRDKVELEINNAFTNKVVSKRIKNEINLEVVEKFIQNDIPIDKLFNTAEKEKILITGGGPSLNDNYDWIKSERDQLIVVAINRNLIPLISNGIIPDFVFAMDSSSDLIRDMVIDKNLCSKIKLIYFPGVQPKVLENWNGLRYFTYPEQLNNREIYSELYCKYPSKTIEMHGSVVLSAVDFARKLDPKNIYLSGFDFSFFGKNTHLAGAVRNHNRQNFTSNDLIVNGNGGLNSTNLSMKGFLRDLEIYIQRNKTVKYINCSRKGAKIDGTVYLD